MASPSVQLLDEYFNNFGRNPPLQQRGGLLVHVPTGSSQSRVFGRPYVIQGPCGPAFRRTSFQININGFGDDCRLIQLASFSATLTLPYLGYNSNPASAQDYRDSFGFLSLDQWKDEVWNQFRFLD